MAKVKVEVLDATVDGAAKGETIEVEKKSAEMLADRGYVKILDGGSKEDSGSDESSSKKKSTRKKSEDESK